MYLTQFRVTRPRFEITQERSLTWLSRAHAEAEATIQQLDDRARARFEVKIGQALRRCGCGPDRIARRGHSIADVESERWGDHTLYDVRRHPHGRGAETRSRLFAEVVEAYFAAEYT